jgi:hypothetical protein
MARGDEDETLYGFNTPAPAGRAASARGIAAVLGIIGRRA